MFINFVPPNTHFFIPSCVECFPTPPDETLEFFKGMPPNITMSSQLSDKAFHELCSSKVE